ncbi:hypothetical protein [Streptomyces misionensis]
MGNARYEIYRNGQKIEAGYDVKAVCEQPDCKAQIDRGLAYLCGNEPGGDEYGCGGYFCANHLYLGSGAPVAEGLCANCMHRWQTDNSAEAWEEDWNESPQLGGMGEELRQLHGQCRLR